MPEAVEHTNPLGFTTLGTPTWPLATVLDRAAAWSCATIELRLIDGAIITADIHAATVQATAAALRASRVTLCTLASSVRLIDADKASADLPRMLEIAARLGARQLRVFSGPASGAGLDADIRRAAAVLNAALPGAHRLGVGIALENHHALSGAHPVADLLSLVPDPAFGVIWDPIYTWIAGDTPAAAWAKLGARTIEIQVKDVIRNDDGKFTPTLLGDGDAPWAESLALALRAGFHGPLVVEWEKQWHPEIADPEVAIPQHLAAIRRMISVVRT